MDWKTFIVRIFEAGVWPFVAALALLFYRNSLPEMLKNLLNKVKSANFKGAELQFVAQSESKAESPEQASKLEELTPKDITGLQSKLENVIRKQLEGIETDENKIKLLISNLAHSQTQSFFERVDYTIFGSQLRLLEHMNSKGDIPINDIEAKDYYNAGRDENPKFYDNYEFHKYMGYLESFGLISRAGEGWKIEEAGQAFLVYMAQPGKSKHKSN